MQVSAIGASVAAPRPTSVRGLGGMKSEDFFRILVTELQNQDPFEPAKTSDMISQVSQIRSIELSGELTDTLELLARQQRLAGTGEWIGKYVYAVTTAVDGTQTLHQGVVTGVSFDAEGQPMVELDTGEVVPATAVVRITTLSEAEAWLAELEEEKADDAAAEKADATQRRRDDGKSWLSLQGALNL